jgi:hypothetical protein
MAAVESPDSRSKKLKGSLIQNQILDQELAFCVPYKQPQPSNSHVVVLHVVFASIRQEGSIKECRWQEF